MKTRVIVGGGLAGIAAAESAARRGERVTLLEWRHALGGRAASFRDTSAESEAWFDNGQHVVLGCCTETLALLKRLGLDDCFERRDGVLFADTSQRRWEFAATPLLPKWLQFVPAFFRTPFLSLGDRVRTALAVRKLGTMRVSDNSGTDTSFAEWASQQSLSAASLDSFWKPLLYSALSETLENVSLAAVSCVVRSGVFGGRDAMAMYVPNRSLREIFHTRVLGALERLGVDVWLGQRAIRIIPEESAISVETSEGLLTVDAAVLALPTAALWRLVDHSPLQPEMIAPWRLNRFEPGAITTLHLWFDQRIPPEGNDACALLGGVGQMLFVPPRPHDDGRSVLHTVVISAAHQLLSEDELASVGHPCLINNVLEQLRQTFAERFAESPTPQLQHARVTTVFDAVFAPKPYLFTLRPPQQTLVPNLTLAGDWTQTDFPATLESAVRSGIAAVHLASG